MSGYRSTPVHSSGSTQTTPPTRTASKNQPQFSSSIVGNMKSRKLKRNSPEVTAKTRAVTNPKLNERKYKKGHWSPEEQYRYDKAIKLYGDDWGKIADEVGTRSKAQVKSHGQKMEKDEARKRRARSQRTIYTYLERKSNEALEELKGRESQTNSYRELTCPMEVEASFYQFLMSKLYSLYSSRPILRKESFLHIASEMFKAELGQSHSEPMPQTSSAPHFNPFSSVPPEDILAAPPSSNPERVLMDSSDENYDAARRVRSEDFDNMVLKL